jgi:DNA repair protein RAD16
MGFVEAGTVLNNYANVFDLLLRLRQVRDSFPCSPDFSSSPSTTLFRNFSHISQTLDHPYLVLHRQQVEGSNQANNEICQICYDPAEEAATSKCKHVFCRVCIETFLQSQGGGLDSSSSSSSTVKSKSSCPVCYRPLTIDLLSAPKSAGEEDEKKRKTTKVCGSKTLALRHSPLTVTFLPSYIFLSKVAGSILQRIDLSNWRSSTKIEALMEELTEMSKTDPNAKALVFTQFVNFLDLIEWRLKLGE